MFNLSDRHALAALTAIALLLSGCGTTKPSRFYTLNPISETESVATASTDAEYGTIGVGPVNLPQYLDRPQIVTRVSPNRFEIAEFDRWGGALKDDFTRTLAENLARLMPAERIATHPWRRAASIDYQIPLEIVRFDGERGKDLVLNVDWQILANGGDTQLISKRSSFEETVAGTSYDDMVAAQSRALGRLAREIAETLKRVSRTADRSRADATSDR